MISREDAIKILKMYWGVTEFTFLAKFELAVQKEKQQEDIIFGFFNELHLNKKQLFFPPAGIENDFSKPASCFSLKGELVSDVFYMVTAELSEDSKRKNKPFALTLLNARKAAIEEIELHKAIIKPKEDKLKAAYVNYVAEDNSHAYIKIIEDLSPDGIKSAKGEKGESIHKVPK